MSDAADTAFHTIAPVWNSESEILILGSFPSVKSRESGFFYGHPQNRFWRVIAELFGRKPPRSIDEKKALLLECKIALWDVIASCEITGSSDASIKNVSVNDISPILSQSKIHTVYVNGSTAAKLYNKYLYPKIQIKPLALPSTSPANASWTFERLVVAWSAIKKQDVIK